jgi:hypothetical protein
VIVPAALAGGAVLLLAGKGDSRPQEPPVPKGLAKQAALDTRRPSVIVEAPPAGDPGGAGGTVPKGGPPPVEVAIPQVGIAARIGPVGAVSGRIELPPVRRAGGYENGPRPGEPGRTVIIGHLDTRTGPAVFANLPQVGRGDQVLVTDAAGRQHAYRVVRALSAPKRFFPASEVFARTPASTLVLITCGGSFDRASGHYQGNVLVFARAARPA